MGYRNRQAEIQGRLHELMHAPFMCSVSQAQGYAMLASDGRMDPEIFIPLFTSLSRGVRGKKH